ncbi:MAG: hypothetical protein ACRC14_05090 [Paracoccaceae bacterium]
MRLCALASHIPADRIETEAIVRAGGGSPAEARVFQRLFGIDHVAVLPADRKLVDQLALVLDRLATATSDGLPDVLVSVGGLPLQFPAMRAALRHLLDAHPLMSAIGRQYEVDQTNCSGLFWALDLARTLLEAGRALRVLVLAGDSHLGQPLSDRYVPGCTLMGDAFCGLILDAAPGGLQLSQIALNTHPEFSFGRLGNVAQMGQFFAAHCRIVRQALDQAGFDWAGREPLLPHNVNSLAWQMFCRETGVAESRVALGLLPDIGHCYTSDPFLLLDRHLGSDNRLAEGATLISVGMGGFAGACRVTPPGRALSNSPADIHSTTGAEPCTQLLRC